MDFQRSTTKVSIYGEVFALQKPTVKQTQAMVTKIKEVETDESGSIDALVGFFKDLGLPTKVAYDMEVEHFLKLVETFTSKKK